MNNPSRSVLGISKMIVSIGAVLGLCGAFNNAAHAANCTNANYTIPCIFTGYISKMYGANPGAVVRIDLASTPGGAAELYLMIDTSSGTGLAAVAGVLAATRKQAVFRDDTGEVILDSITVSP